MPQIDSPHRGPNLKAIVGLDLILWVVIAGFLVAAQEVRHDTALRMAWGHERYSLAMEYHVLKAKHLHNLYGHFRGYRKA